MAFFIHTIMNERCVAARMTTDMSTYSRQDTGKDTSTTDTATRHQKSLEERANVEATKSVARPAQNRSRTKDGAGSGPKPEMDNDGRNMWQKLWWLGLV